MTSLFSVKWYINKIIRISIIIIWSNNCYRHHDKSCRFRCLYLNIIDPKRVFRDAMLQTVGDMTSALKIGTNITDRICQIDPSYVECVFMCPSDWMAIVEIYIHKIPYPDWSRSLSHWQKIRVVVGLRQDYGYVNVIPC